MITFTTPHGAHRADRPKRRLMIGLGLAGGLAALVLAGSVSPASAGGAAAGTWTYGPTQATSYQAAVRAPINADGSSNFKAKNGVIPVQFDLLAGTSPFVWESVSGDSSTANDFTFASFTPTTPIPLDLLNLGAVYNFTAGHNGGGSLRWSLGLDYDGNGTRDGGTWVYYGTYPNFTDDGSQSGVDMRTLTDQRVDTTNAGGTFYDTWAGLAALHPGVAVTSATLVMDSGWAQVGGVQRANVSNVQVNGNTFIAPASSSPAKTCNLPAAGLRWAKDDNSATGAVNEADSVQPKDTGEYYRQVDCKYIYNLSVSSLDGVGSYNVWVNIGGTNVQAPAQFDLK